MILKKLHRRYAGDSRQFAIIISIFILATAAVAAIAGNQLISHIKAGVRRTSIQVISELTDNKAVMLNGILNEAKADITILAEYLDASSENSKIYDLLEGFQKSHETDKLIVLDAQGKCIYGEISQLPEEILKAFDAELSIQMIAMSDVVRLDQGKRFILFGAQTDAGERVYAAISVEALQQAYGENTYKNQGYSYIVESNGEIEIPPIRYSYEQMYGNIRHLLETDSNNDESKIQAFMEALAEGKAGSVVFSFEGQQQMLCFKPLDTSKGWQLVTVVPLTAVENDGAQIIRASVGMAGIIVAVIVITSGLCIFFYFLMRRNQKDNDRFLRNVYQAISENIDTVIFILDDSTKRLDYIFENSERLLGIPQQEFMEGENNSKDGTFKETILSLLQEQKPESPLMQEMHIYNDRLQKDMWLKILICPFLLGGIQKHIYAVTDVTEERKARENITAAVVAAEQASSAKTSFLANMSHDMRTPMNGIVGMTAIAKNNLDDRKRVEDCLNKIDLSSSHLLNLINDVLDMSKIESGKLAMECEPFDMMQILRNLENIMRPQYEDKDQSFIISIQVRHTKLLGDSMHMSQILMNLLSNAMKFTPEGGMITLLAEELEQRHTEFASYRFTVTDTGIGMSSEFLKTLFTPFERADVKQVQNTEGTGLGMAIAKNLVTAMGGQILVESKLGQGSVFTVEIELLMQNPGLDDTGTVKDKGSVNPDFTGKRLLLAEDNEINREIASVLLQERGALIEEAENGKLAVECFEASAYRYYDAILMDIMMPVMNGYEAAREIRASEHPQGKTIPIVAMTANAFAEDVKASKDAGMNAHIAKPIDVDVLFRTLTEVMKEDERGSKTV